MLLHRVWDGVGRMLTTALHAQPPYELVGPFYDGWVLCDAWAVADAELLRRCDGFDLLGCPDVLADGQLLFPTFQFTPELRVRPELVALMRLLCRTSAERWWVATWLRSPHGELEGLSPVAWLDAGEDFGHVAELADLTGRSTLHR